MTAPEQLADKSLPPRWYRNRTRWLNSFSLLFAPVPLVFCGLWCVLSVGSHEYIWAAAAVVCFGALCWLTACGLLSGIRVSADGVLVRNGFARALIPWRQVTAIVVQPNKLSTSFTPAIVSIGRPQLPARACTVSTRWNKSDQMRGYMRAAAIVEELRTVGRANGVALDSPPLYPATLPRRPYDQALTPAPWWARVLGRALGVLILLAAGAGGAYLLGSGLHELGPAYEAATGHGIRGTFLPLQQSCLTDGVCTWNGTFTGPYGLRLANVQDFGQLAERTAAAARYTGSANWVYPWNDGIAWRLAAVDTGFGLGWIDVVLVMPTAWAVGTALQRRRLRAWIPVLPPQAGLGMTEPPE